MEFHGRKAICLICHLVPTAECPSSFIWKQIGNRVLGVNSELSALAIDALRGGCSRSRHNQALHGLRPCGHVGESVGRNKRILNSGGIEEAAATLSTNRAF